MTSLWYSGLIATWSSRPQQLERKIKTLKHENVAEIGDTIKAYDFPPIEGRAEEFIVGLVTAKRKNSYTVTVIESPEYIERVGIEMGVPFENVFGEFDTRVTKV